VFAVSFQHDFGAFRDAALLKHLPFPLITGSRLGIALIYSK